MFEWSGIGANENPKGSRSQDLGSRHGAGGGQLRRLQSKFHTHTYWPGGRQLAWGSPEVSVRRKKWEWEQIQGSQDPKESTSKSPETVPSGHTAPDTRYPPVTRHPPTHGTRYPEGTLVDNKHCFSGTQLQKPCRVRVDVEVPFVRSGATAEWPRSKPSGSQDSSS